MTKHSIHAMVLSGLLTASPSLAQLNWRRSFTQLSKTISFRCLWN